MEIAALNVAITDKMVEAATIVLQDSGRLSVELEGVDQILAHEMLEAALSCVEGTGQSAKSHSQGHQRIGEAL